MSNNGSMWKRLIRKTIGKREEKVHKDDDVVFVNFEVDRKGIIRTLIDDHRDAAMYRHAMRSLYCKIKGDYVGKTVKHEDESGCVQMLFREVDKLMKRNKELEAIIQERKR